VPLEIQTALISAIVALCTAIIGGYLTWSQIRRERKKWLADLKTSYAMELYKTRLASYPEVYRIISKLSSRATDPLTPSRAQQIAHEINDWFYSVGGLCADVNTRAALIELRETCLSWTQGDKPINLTRWRNATLMLLRRDLDLHGLESFDFEDRETPLKILEKEASKIKM
jgi:hypothetical protein